MNDFFHLTAGDKEVAATELPGELWAELFAEPAREAAIATHLTNGCAMPKQDGVSPVISVHKFLGSERTRLGEQICQTLDPYVRQAMDLGYDYLVLTN